VSVAGSVQLLREKHLKFSVRQGKKVLPVIGFKMEQYERLVNEAPLLDIVYTPQFNSYRGNTTIQLSLRDIRPHQEM
jgi:single-stranded-DNA-specific exonuclease